MRDEPRSTAENADGQSESPDTRNDIHVLFIEGEASFMPIKYQTYKSFDGKNRFAHLHPFRVCCCDPCYFEGDDEYIPPDAFGAERCYEEIESGRYHAIIVMDLPRCEYDFELMYGHLIKAFVDAGGVVAFPSSEGNIVETLGEMFDIDWRPGSYYRSNWGPCLGVNETNIQKSFGKGKFSKQVIKDYSVKATTLVAVPLHERCFGLTDHSKRSWGEDISVEADDPNYEAVVAMHEHGKGVIAYFGDVNAEDQTIELVAAFIESRAPRQPIDCFSGLEQITFVAILQLKEEGNEHFTSGRIDDAIVSECQIALLSNLTLMYMKKEQFYLAEASALQALQLQGNHSKCSYHLAKARFNISRKTRGGDLARLREASLTLLNAEPGNATNNLMRNVKEEIEKLEKKAKGRTGSGVKTKFASATSG